MLTTKRVKICASMLLIASVTAACGGGGASLVKEGAAPQPRDEPAAPAKPVTLVMLQDGATISKEEFENLVAAPVKAKYPHITVELRTNTQGEKGIESMIAAGDFPDFMFTIYPRITLHKNMGTAYDLSEFIKKYKVEIGKFDPAAIETARVYGSKDKMYALPFSLNFLAMFYNKDIFDMFGVDYPKDGMTWEEVVALGKRVTRAANGIEYRGLSLPGLFDLNTQLSLPYLDPATGKAKVTTDGWKKVFELIKTVDEIPGTKETVDRFLKNQTLAMLPSYDARIAALEKLHNTPEQFNWDMVQFPSHPERPNVSVASSGHFLMVSALSNNKEDAFRAVEVLTSKETQKLIANHGRFTSLNDPELKAAYGNNMKSLQGKNVKGVFKSSFALPFAASKDDALVQSPLNAALKKVLNGETDINSALREAEEAANKAIEAKNK